MLPPTVRCKWTELDSIAMYRALVSAAREKAGRRPLSEWELNRKRTLAVTRVLPGDEKKWWT